MVVMTVTLDSQNKDGGGGGERDLRDDRDTLISSKKGEEEEKRSDVACDGIMRAAVKKTHIPNAIKPQFPRRKPRRRRNNHE